MSAIFGESLIFRQKKGPDVTLLVNGDEFYARYETLGGYTVVYDLDLGQFCYADLRDGRFVSTAAPIGKQPPAGLRRHLKEAPQTRNAQFAYRRSVLHPPEPRAASHMMRTRGPNQGLLEGRRVSDGPVHGLTILVEFADVQSTVTTADVAAMLNDGSYTANGNFCSVRGYFRTLSDGMLDYTNTVVGPVRLPQNQAYYREHLLVRPALDIVAAQLHNDFAPFDSRGEKIIDAVNFLYAGRTLYEGELWPHNASIGLGYGDYRTFFYMLTSMGRSAVDLSIGTFCHESGHLLCRFPDLYDYGEQDGDFEESHGIGTYCLMGSGNHLDRGRTPAPICGYLRELVGWVKNPIVLQNVGDFQARHGEYGTLLKYETSRPDEYFIVENRSRLGLDRCLPAEGLAIYHCDRQGSNEWQGGTADRHYQCGLLQADGHLDLEKNLNGGDEKDLYANRAGVALSHQTMPSTRQWDGSDSGLVISDVSAPGAQMTFRLGRGTATNTVSRETTTDLLIPDKKTAGVRSVVTITESGTVAAIRARVSIIHPRIADLRVELIAPSGRSVMLHDRAGGDTSDLKQIWDSQSFQPLAALAGEPIQGDWTLVLRDLKRGGTGRLNWWGLALDYSTPYQTATGTSQPNLSIPDADPNGVQSLIAIDAAGTTKDIRVLVEIAHPYRGDLQVSLVTPSGRRAVIHNRTGGSQSDLRATCDVASAPALAGLLGEPIQGNWALQVLDLEGMDVGTLERWALTLSY